MDPLTGHTDSVSSVAFSPDGHRIASTSEDDTIRVWDAATGQVIAGPFTGHTSSVTSVVFSLDGQRIASAPTDRTIRVWDATTGWVVAGPFTGHASYVSMVALSPDGQRVASASYDRTIRVWHAITGQVVTGGHTDSAPGNCAIHGEKAVTESIEKIHFADQALVNNDGFICGENEELLMWIPELHRSGLHRPSTAWISGEHETRLDLSKFVRGSNWVTVRDHNLSE